MITPAVYSFVSSEADLLKPGLVIKRNISPFQYDLCRLLCPQQRAGHSDIDLYVFHAFRCLFCETASVIVERDIRPPLYSMTFIPVRFSVTDNV